MAVAARHERIVALATNHHIVAAVAVENVALLRTGDLVVTALLEQVGIGGHQGRQVEFVAVAIFVLDTGQGSADQVAVPIFQTVPVNLDIVEIIAIGIMQFEPGRFLLRCEA